MGEVRAPREAHRTDDLVRGFSTKRQLPALLFGQLSGASSLRDIQASMASHQAGLYDTGSAAPARSTLADANHKRDFRVFSELFMHMPDMATRGLRRKIGEAVRRIDSTSLHLAGAGAKWARFSAEVCGAKAHVVWSSAKIAERLRLPDDFGVAAYSHLPGFSADR